MIAQFGGKAALPACLRTGIGMMLMTYGAVFADVIGHPQADTLLAEAARLAPAAQAVAMNFGAVSPTEYAVKGNWSAIIPWTPHIPVSAALLADGRLLTFASNQRTTFPDGPQFTYAAVWDPATGLFTELNNPRHDMFCGGLAQLQDGRLMVNGGNGILGTTAQASLFDWRTNEWSAAQTMPEGRWYNTSVALPSGEIFTAGGNGGGNGTGTTDQWHATSGWRRMSGVNWSSVVNAPIPDAIEPNWHPFLLVAPDGRLAHFGPHQALNWITNSGTGSLTPAGATLPGTHYPKQGAWAMYAPGKVLVAGGLQAIDNGTVVNQAFTVDLNGATPVVTPTASMANARSFSNAVILPNGEVMVVGGTQVGAFFSDVGTIYTPEIWNPATGQWRTAADASVPRNYHSVALLLPDGRVWSGGGGLYGDGVVDHQDAQVFTPPQLYNSDGSLAARPQLIAAPERIGPGAIFTVNATPGVAYFSFIRLSSLTHSVNTDQRHLRFTHNVTAPGEYALTAPASINVLTPGYWMMYAVDANGVWSVSRIIQVTNATLPVVTNPGEQRVTQGSTVSLPVNASTATGTLSYSAAGLPSGVLIHAATGLISGTASATPGTYRSTVYVTSAGQVSSVTFNWIVVLPDLGSGQIMREWWTGIGGTAVANLPGNVAYPANPNGRDLLPSFAAPQNWDDSTGQRVRGFLHVPITGQYRFYISSDDHSSLLLSTDETPLNAVQIASQQDYTPPQTWTWYAQQASALITLNAGTRYYIEAVMKDGSGDDHLEVGWQKPGDSAISVIAGTYLSPYLPSANPAVAWSLDEATWNGTGSEVKASTAGLFQMHGSASGGATTAEASPALSGDPGTHRYGVFNGSTQSISVPYNAALNPQDFTIAAWVRCDALSGAARCILTSRDDSGSTKRGYGLWLTSDGRWQLRTGLESAALNGPVLTVGQWTHIAATFRTTSSGLRTGTRRIFVNGVQAAEDSGVYQVNATKPLVIGAADVPGTAFFAGAVDEVTLYHAPLSQPDILALRDQRHASSGTPANQPPQITSPGTQNTIIGAVVSLPVIASDPENNPITFSATGLPTGLTISPNSGVISGTVTTVGAFNVTVQASDGLSAPARVSFVWNVSNGLTLQPLTATPKPASAAQTYTAQSADGLNPRYKWNFGDGTSETDWSASSSVAHTFANPGRYLVTLTATDDSGIVISSTFYQAIHAPLTARKPNTSTSIVFEDLTTANDRVWCVNPDNNSVTAFDVVTKTRYSEINVGISPRALAFAPDGRLWVTNMEGGTISIINTGTRKVAATVTLPRGSQPFGLVFDPAGAAAWVALEGTGRVLKLNPSTGAQLATIDAGGPVRHLSISADGARVYATRFITPRVAGENTATPILAGAGGQVVVIGTAALAVERTILLNPSTAFDSETAARGLPNYLGAAVISPDGLSAWVPSKQDNIQRGILRDAKPLNHEVTLRSIVSRLDLTTQAEDLASRVDIDNAGMPSAAAYDPWGIYVFTTLEASREVVILDAWTRQEILRFPAGRAPQGVTLSPNGGTLYVQNFMDRTITVHDVGSILSGGGSVPVTTATLNTVTTEKLTAQVLLGKQLFYDAKDPRLALQEYMSCATCHNDGGHDGRVWDLTGFGEGLRNTITLKGHANHGTLHWTGNFDEVHDFEGQIRTLAGGSGLMTDAQFNTSTRNQPLGAPKAGVSTDLDALATYVQSLTTNGKSPQRNSNGTLTVDATAGQQIFRAQNCAACHSGAAFTSSALNVFANIGTLKPTSGNRLGAALTGLDVPTLRGVWATAPYLHDGSAATLAEAISAHQGLALSAADMTKLVAFVASIDDTPTTAPLPFTLALSTPASNVTGPFTVTASFNSSATGFALSDIVVTNGVASSFSGSGLTYTFLVTPTAPGAVTVSVPANAASDSTALGNLAANLLEVSYAVIDSTPPAVTLSTPASNISGAFVVTATFSEIVTGLLANEFVVTNGTATALSGAGTVWSATITPATAGSVTIQLPAGRAQDAAGNPNTASNLLSVTYAPSAAPQIVKLQAEDFDEGGEGVAYHDTDAANIGLASSGLSYRATGVDIEPSEDTDGTPSIGWIAAGEWLRYTTPLNAGAYDIKVRMATVFAGPSRMRVLINGTLVSTINITATGGWSVWRTFTVSGINLASSGPATVRIEFPDGNLNFNWIEFVNTSSTPDTTPPAVTLATATTNVAAPFNVTATFSESVTGVALNDFIVTNGTASALSGSGATYSVTITPTASGAVTVAMPVEAAFDASSNVSLASNTLSVTYTAPLPVPPEVTLATAAANVTAPFTVSATFNQAVTGVALNDFTVTNGSASALSGSGSAYSVTITPAAAGAVTVRVPAAAAVNATGQGNTVSNLLTVNYTLPDTTPPAVVLSTPSTSVSGAFVVTTTFSETVTGLLANEYVVTNGSITALATAGAVWSATVTPAAAGNVTVRLPASMALDAAGNGNTASNLLTVVYTPPPPATNGITADYFIGKNFEQAALSRIDPNIDFTWTGSPASGLPADGFSVRWQGSIVPTASGVFDFITRSDDGVRLWLNGVLVINNWTNHGETWDNATLALQAGVPVSLKMEFYENTGGAMARLFWDGPGANFVAVPSGVLRPLTATAPLASMTQTRILQPADVDGDSVPDLLEQVLGTASSSGIAQPDDGLQLVARDGGAVDATLLRPAGQSGVTFTLEATADLNTWSRLVVSPTIVSLGNGWERVTWSNLQAIAGQSLARGIIRLRITRDGGSTATTMPVGWQQAALRSGIQSFGLNLSHAAVFTGIVSSASTTIFSVGEQADLATFVDPGFPYYVEILSGAHAGHRFDLQHTTASACVIVPDSPQNTLTALPAGLIGARIALRPHVTLAAVFEPTRFLGSATAATADQILFHTGSAYRTCWLYQNGNERRWVQDGDTTLADQSGAIIPPGTGLMLKLTTTPAPLIFTGSVRTTAFARPLQTGYNLIASPWPLDATPARTGLTSSVVVATTFFATADQLQLWKGDTTPSGTGYVGYWLFKQPSQLVPTWVASSDATLLSQNNANLLRAGRATFLKVQPNPSRPVWIIPPP